MCPDSANDDVDIAGDTQGDHFGDDTIDDTVDDLEVPDAERIASEAPRHTPLYAALSGWMLATEAWLRSHGGRGLRLGLRIFWGAIALAGLVLLLGPVINKPLTLEDITGSASEVTSRWIARDFAVDYRLSRAEDGALRAQVEERIAAHFPSGVEMDSIERVLATQYQGHALNPSAIEATLDGVPLPIARAERGNQLVLTLGGETQLQGDHEFVIRYELHNLAYPERETSNGQTVDLLSWDVFGPSWPQGLAAFSLNLTVPDNLDEQLIRQPRASISWLIIGGAEWLTAEPGDGEVTYRFVSDQKMPPHAQARFTMNFEAGTFTMPPTTMLFWIQTFGPLVPLAFLALTLLFALAARAVAWGDARGRPWYVARYDPPKGLTTATAAQILRTPATAELAEALDGARGDGSAGGRGARREPLIAAARIAQRTGRIGDLPRALTSYFTASARRLQLTSGIRRIPHGFVRDFFIAAPIALTLVQWGLVRQLSHQSILAVVWWPTIFVLAAALLAAIIVWIAFTVRPLTRAGALAKQHLLGIGAYADRAQLLERSDTREPVLAYAVLMAPPRTAGARVVELIEGELNEPGASRQWQTRDFLSWSRILVRALALLLVIGAIGTAIFLPNPYAAGADYASYTGDIPGTRGVEVQSFEASAVLSRSAEGRARLAVSEQLRAEFSNRGSTVPQFAQQWPNRVEGQNLGLQVEAVRIDGRAVPFVTEQDHDTLLLRTTMTEVLVGTREVQVDYVLNSAAVATEHDGVIVDSVRWAALLDGWEANSRWGRVIENEKEPVRIHFRIADELLVAAKASGWITKDRTGKPLEAYDWAPSLLPFDTAEGGSTHTGPDGDTHTLTVEQDEYGGWPLDLIVDDLGARVIFAAGTFTEPDPGARLGTKLLAAIPVALFVSFAGLGLVLGLAGILAGAARVRRAFDQGMFRDLLWWLLPGATLAAVILFAWMANDMSRSDFAANVFGWLTLAAFSACVAGMVLTRRSRGR